jgi:hypothetical protein
VPGAKRIEPRLLVETQPLQVVGEQRGGIAGGRCSRVRRVVGHRSPSPGRVPSGSRIRETRHGHSGWRQRRQRGHPHPARLTSGQSGGQSGHPHPARLARDLSSDADDERARTPSWDSSPFKHANHGRLGQTTTKKVGGHDSSCCESLRGGWPISVWGKPRPRKWVAMIPPAANLCEVGGQSLRKWVAMIPRWTPGLVQHQG